jgi:hypothetical protein
MAPAEPHGPLPLRALRAHLAVLLLGAALSLTPLVWAQTRTKTQNGPAVTKAEEGIHWQDLKADHRVALKPLEREWVSINSSQKQKWLEIAERFPTLAPDEQTRIQARMGDWARMTPEQRGQARVNFQQAKQVAPRDRQAQWEAYQSLSPEERGKLAARATRPSVQSGADASKKGPRPEYNDKAKGDAQQAKSNIVPNPAFAAPPKPVAPTVIQAQPGATTTLISRQAAPPPHQQTGMPKIAASPNFVDTATLLPQRGPQGAATQSAAASGPEGTRRR